MFAWMSLTLLALATTWTGAAKLHSYGLPDNRIVGGAPAREGEIPYQVSIRRNRSDGNGCGGALITPIHVLTADHCVRQRETGVLLPPSEVGVVAGQLTLPITKDTIFRQASRIVFHKRYNEPANFFSDIAIIKVHSPFPTDNPSISVIPLRRYPINAGACVVSGWGRTHELGNSSDILLVAKVSIVNFNKCKSLYNGKRPILPGAVCAGQNYAPTGACKGDSGGPLVCGDYLTGIVSGGGAMCTHPHLPGIYTDVAQFLPWIEYTINNY